MNDEPGRALIGDNDIEGSFAILINEASVEGGPQAVTVAIADLHPSVSPFSRLTTAPAQPSERSESVAWPLLAELLPHSSPEEEAQQQQAVAVDEESISTSRAANLENDLLRRARARVAFKIQCGFVAFFSALACLTLWLAPPWKTASSESCSTDQRVWPFVWCCFMATHVSLLAINSLCRWRFGSARVEVTAAQRVMRFFSTFWFFTGLRPLFWEPPCDRTSALVGRTFWYFHATFYLLPLLLYLALCLCFPCIVLALNRLRPPGPNSHPTPPDVIAKLRKMKFADFVEECRRKYGLANVEQGAFVTESLRTNPLVDTITGNATVSDGAGGGGCRLDKCCPICMADFEDADTILVMPCDFRHFFHETCVREWLETSQCCPICRANVVELLR